jgi:hypothetical protein
MLKVNISKAQPIATSAKDSACKSVTIIIDKEWKSPDPTGLTNELFYKELDKSFNDEAMRLAEALQNSLPGGTWDRFVGIVTRRHASYLIVNREEIGRTWILPVRLAVRGHRCSHRASGIHDRGRRDHHPVGHVPAGPAPGNECGHGLLVDHGRFCGLGCFRCLHGPSQPKDQGDTWKRAST